MARGHWRLDYLALASLGREVRPVLVEPVAVEKNGRRDPAALRSWRGGQGHVVTLPGDVCRIDFVLPRAAPELELFLESGRSVVVAGSLKVSSWIPSSWQAVAFPVT